MSRFLPRNLQPLPLTTSAHYMPGTPRANDHAFANDDDLQQASAHTPKPRPMLHAKRNRWGQTEEKQGQEGGMG